MKKTTLNRRDALKTAGVALLALSPLAALAQSKKSKGGAAPAAAGATLPFVTAKDPAMAASVKFEEKAADATKQCKNCILYTAEAGGTSGKCTLFQGYLVKAEASCASFAKKA